MICRNNLKLNFSDFRILSTKLEIKLRKAEGVRWTCLEGDGSDPVPGVVVQPSTSGIHPPTHSHTYTQHSFQGRERKETGLEGWKDGGGVVRRD